MKKLTYKFVKEQIEKEGYFLISKEYVNSQTKLSISCPKGHEYEVKWNKFQQGRKCRKCLDNKRSKDMKHSYDFIKKQFKNKKWDLLSKEYINSSQHLDVICPNGHISKKRYSDFYSGYGCSECSSNKKYTYEEVKSHIDSEGYKLISKEYINVNTKLNMICDIGHKCNITYYRFNQGQRCRKCYIKKWINNKYSSKGGVTKRNIPLYDTYAHQIDYAEEVRRNPEDKNILQVRCTYCNKWYTPKTKTIYSRIAVLKGNITGESRFYCSPKCKRECPIYHKKIYQTGHPHSDNIKRPYQKEWSMMVCERENHICEICGKYGNIGHHILPVKTHPHLQADVDNGICLCMKCHYKYGHKDECSTGNLARMVC